MGKNENHQATKILLAHHTWIAIVLPYRDVRNDGGVRNNRQPYMATIPYIPVGHKNGPEGPLEEDAKD
jgi:hypothetical protein